MSAKQESATFIDTMLEEKYFSDHLSDASSAQSVLVNPEANRHFAKWLESETKNLLNTIGKQIEGLEAASIYNTEIGKKRQLRKLAVWYWGVDLIRAHGCTIRLLTMICVFIPSLWEEYEAVLHRVTEEDKKNNRRPRDYRSLEIEKMLEELCVFANYLSQFAYKVVHHISKKHEADTSEDIKKVKIYFMIACHGGVGQFSDVKKRRDIQKKTNQWVDILREQSINSLHIPCDTICQYMLAARWSKLDFDEFLKLLFQTLGKRLSSKASISSFDKTAQWVEIINESK